MNSRKRASNWIDLTSDDENPPQKQTRLNAQGSQPPPSQSFASASQIQRDDNDGNEILDLGQDVDEGFGWLCVGAIDGKIVGIRYYDGYASMGEQVMIKREPSNPYDVNAVRINNVQGTQIGHLPRNLAAKLAPYMYVYLQRQVIGCMIANYVIGIREALSSRARLLERRGHGTALFNSRSLDPPSLSLVRSWKPK